MPKGQFLVRRRAESGLLGGMLEFPSTAWLVDAADERAASPVYAEWQALPGTIRHTFTHFHLQLQAVAARAQVAAPAGHFWLHPDEFEGSALPSVMLKVARHAQFALLMRRRVFCSVISSPIYYKTVNLFAA